MGRHAKIPIPVEEQDWYHAIPATQAAKCFPVSYSTLIRWANEGKIHAWKPGYEWFVSVLSLKRILGAPQDAEKLLELLPQTG